MPPAPGGNAIADAFGECGRLDWLGAGDSGLQGGGTVYFGLHHVDFEEWKMGTPVVLSDGEFATDVLASDKPVLVDFWASWCGPCKMIAPVLEEVAVEYDQQLVVGKLDVDQNQQTAQAHSVFSIPTLILFKDGQPVERIVGFKPKEALMAAITPHLD